MTSIGEPGTSLLRIVGPGGTLDVWLGSEIGRAGLEADVREASATASGHLPDLAMALGAVARRHKLEVRVIPRFGADGPSLLVLFGQRTYRAR